ncbi:helix-turn-helix transcriptional regulator [Xylanimonas protaetiae]|uniref:WYL domain-containing protein n=1 Tax=Xylanimonas protaetiae TaxID=2509457 RepID=A0A4P6F507_9MICO|nr:WYL domain-containing protein [Xylanimonas protaetiae]QAY71020.1 WYL domain-containing protein [Xylanimonas protaetiae]
MAERADDRLVRLLGLVAFLDEHGPVPVAELADRFGVTEKQIRDDVDQLWVTGTPGYWPDDLIDFDADAVERGVVHLTESRGLTRPLRLGTREAIALVAALRALVDSPPVQADPERTALVRSALDKLSAATGEAASAVDVRIAHDGDPAVLQAVTAALADRRALRIRYVTASDVVSERDVDPARLLTQDGAAYLLAWCRRAQDRRTFRLDRVLAATVLDEPADADRIAAVDRDEDVAASAASAGGATTVTVTFASPARWLAEQLATEAVTELADGAFALRLRISNPAWLRSVLLAAAPDVLAVEPADVAAEVAASARAALAAYGEPGS